jgi:hypothetical protein
MLFDETFAAFTQNEVESRWGGIPHDDVIIVPATNWPIENQVGMA